MNENKVRDGFFYAGIFTMASAMVGAVLHDGLTVMDENADLCKAGNPKCNTTMYEAHKSYQTAFTAAAGIGGLMSIGAAACVPPRRRSKRMQF